MEREELKEKYFNWLFRTVYKYDSGDLEDNFSFVKLAMELFDIQFQVSYPMDENRISDGIYLRYEFGIDKGYDDRIITCCLDDVPCSVFEVMVGLAKRCESQIMSDSEYGDRTSQWYNEMVVSLGLGGMYNMNFDVKRVHEVCNKMMNHEYEPNGKGGLFTVRHPDRDMRNLELWAQMCDHLNELLF